MYVLTFLIVGALTEHASSQNIMESCSPNATTCMNSRMKSILNINNNEFSGLNEVKHFQNPMGVTDIAASMLVRLCRNVDDYINFTDCIYDEIEKCPYGMSQMMLPEKTNVEKGLRFFCSKLADINMDCINQNLQALSGCLMEFMQNVDKTDLTTEDSESRRAKLATFTCRTYAATTSCFDTIVRPCSAKTADLMSKYMSYSTPRVCSLATSMTMSYSFLVMILLLFLLMRCN